MARSNTLIQPELGRFHPLELRPFNSCDKRPFCRFYHAVRQISYCGSVHLLNPITILQWYAGIYRKQIRYWAQTLYVHGMRDENWSERSSLSLWMIDIMTWKNIYRLIFGNGSTLRAKDLYKVSTPTPKKKTLNR